MRPMSSSRPVPGYRFPKKGVVYQSVRQGVAGLPLTASAACCGSSPPPGPKAATPAGVRACAATGLSRSGGGRAGLRRAGLDAGRDRRGRAGLTAVGRVLAAGRGRGSGFARSGHELVDGEAEDGQDQHGEQPRPPDPAPLALPQRDARLEHLGRRDLRRGPPPFVELLDQRGGIGAHRLGDGPDMAPRVEVTAAGRVVVLLDAPDDVLPDPGALTDLGHGEPGMAAGRRQRRADAQARLPTRRAIPGQRKGCRGSMPAYGGL